MRVRLCQVLFCLAAAAVFAGCGTSSTAPSSSTRVSTGTSTVSTPAATKGTATVKATPASGAKPVPRASAVASAKLTKAATVFDACMRAHGVNPLTPSSLAKKGSAKTPALQAAVKTIKTPAYVAAVNKCGVGLRHAFQQLRPQVAQAFREKEAEAAKRAPKHSHLQPALKSALEKFSACMREHGVNLPAPVTTGGSIFNMRGVNKSSPQFKAAETACNSLLVAAS